VIIVNNKEKYNKQWKTITIILMTDRSSILMIQIMISGYSISIATPWKKSPKKMKIYNHLDNQTTIKAICHYNINRKVSSTKGSLKSSGPVLKTKIASISVKSAAKITTRSKSRKSSNIIRISSEVASPRKCSVLI